MAKKKNDNSINKKPTAKATNFTMKRKNMKFTGSWEIPAAATNSTNRARWERQWCAMRLTTKKLANGRKDAAGKATVTECKAHVYNTGGKELNQQLNRNSYFPYTSTALLSVTLVHRANNAKGDGPNQYTTYTLQRPKKPNIAISYNAEKGETTFTFTADGDAYENVYDRTNTYFTISEYVCKVWPKTKAGKKGNTVAYEKQTLDVKRKGYTKVSIVADPNKKNKASKTWTVAAAKKAGVTIKKPIYGYLKTQKVATVYNKPVREVFVGKEKKYVYDSPYANSLSASKGEYIRLVVTAEARGVRGSSETVTKTRYLGPPAYFSISSITLSQTSKTGGTVQAGNRQVIVSTNSTQHASKPVDKVQLQRLRNVDITTATAAGASLDWVDVEGAVDDAQTKGLVDEYLDGLPDVGMHTWYRFKSTHDNYTVYGTAVEAKVLFRPVPPEPTVADEEAYITKFDTQVMKNENPETKEKTVNPYLQVDLEVTATNKVDATGIEISWSDKFRAWRSNVMIDSMDVDWLTKVNDRKKTATAWIWDLDPSVPYYFYTRPYYDDEDGNRTYGKYRAGNYKASTGYPHIMASDPDFIPTDVTLTVPKSMVYGKEIPISWTYQSDTPIEEYKVYMRIKTTGANVVRTQKFDKPWTKVATSYSVSPDYPMKTPLAEEFGSYNSAKNGEMYVDVGMSKPRAAGDPPEIGNWKVSTDGRKLTRFATTYWDRLVRYVANDTGNKAKQWYTLKYSSDYKNWALLKQGVTKKESEYVSSYIVPANKIPSNAVEVEFYILVKNAAGWSKVSSASQKRCTILQKPTITVTSNTVANAQPYRFRVTVTKNALESVANTTNCRVITKVRSRGIIQERPDGDRVRAVDDIIYEKAVSPKNWVLVRNASNSDVISKMYCDINLPKGLDLVDGGQYYLEVSVEYRVQVADYNAKDPASRYAKISSGVVKKTFSVQWAHQAKPPKETSVVVAELGSLTAQIKPVAPNGAYTTDVCDIYRVTPDGAQLVAENVKFGTTAIDRYAPYSKVANLRYRLMTKTLDGDIEWIDIPYDLKYYPIRFDWGRDRFLEIPYNLTHNDKFEKDFERRAHLDGSRDGYWNPGTNRDGSFTTDLIRLSDPEQQERVREMAQYTGPIFVRLPDGCAYPANVSVDGINSSYESLVLDVSFTANQISMTDEFRIQAKDMIQVVM